MTSFLCAVLALLPGQYIVTVNAPDGSGSQCAATGYTIDGVTLVVDATACVPDEIFKGGFE